MESTGFVFKYSENPEVDEDGAVTTITSTTVIIEPATIDQVERIVNDYIEQGEEVELVLKHKFPRD